jgi:2-iminobutanoate/2-iminopropanoate deaminase
MRKPRLARAAALVAFPLVLPFMLGACASAGGGAEAGPTKEILTPGGGERPLFSTVVRSGDVLYLSGVIGRSADGDAGAATRQALEGVQSRLAQVGRTMRDVLKCTVYLIDMDDYAAMNEVYLEYFTPDPPARTAVAVRALPVNAQVEVDCIATAR